MLEQVWFPHDSREPSQYVTTCRLKDVTPGTVQYRVLLTLFDAASAHVVPLRENAQEQVTRRKCSSRYRCCVNHA